MIARGFIFQTPLLPVFQTTQEEDKTEFQSSYNVVECSPESRLSNVKSTITVSLNHTGVASFNNSCTLCVPSTKPRQHLQGLSKPNNNSSNKATSNLYRRIGLYEFWEHK